MISFIASNRELGVSYLPVHSCLSSHVSTLLLEAPYDTVEIEECILQEDFTFHPDLIQKSKFELEANTTAGN